MANITIKDLIVKTNSVDLLNNSTEFVQDLSEKELALKGGVSGIGLVADGVVLVGKLNTNN